MDDFDAKLTRNRLPIAGSIGAISFLLFWLAGGWGFFGAFFAGIIVFAIFYGLIRMIGPGVGHTSRGAVPHVGGAVTTEPGTARPSAGSPVPSDAAPVAGTVRDETGSSSGPAGTPPPLAGEATPRSDIPPSPASAPTAATPAPAKSPALAPSAGPATPPVSVSAAAEPSAPVAVAREPGTGLKPATLAAPKDGAADDLKRIKGVGPKLEILCNSLGFWHFDQIAGWSDAEVDWVDAHLEGFKGRVRRDDWVAQARSLSSEG